VTLPTAAASETAPPRPDREVPGPACGSVMIVDDNADAAASLAEVLVLLGAPAVVARDGAEALGIAEAGPLPDIVLLDIGLPGLDGYEVAREWRRRFGRHARLVALTGYGSPEDRRRTAQAGFDAHLVKPVALDQLMALLRAVPAARGP
jgi:CheY-like chemotaxis protein